MHKTPFSCVCPPRQKCQKLAIKLEGPEKFAACFLRTQLYARLSFCVKRERERSDVALPLSIRPLVRLPRAGQSLLGLKCEPAVSRRLRRHFVTPQTTNGQKAKACVCTYWVSLGHSWRNRERHSRLARARENDFSGRLDLFLPVCVCVRHNKKPTFAAFCEFDSECPRLGGPAP